MSPLLRRRPSASLRHSFLRLLLSVAGLFAAGIALSLWLSLHANGRGQQRLRGRGCLVQDAAPADREE